MYFSLWLLFSVLLHSIVYWVMSDNLIASATTFVNIIMTISLMVAKYIMYRDDLKNGYIDISKDSDKYKLFSELSIYLPLFIYHYLFCLYLQLWCYSVSYFLRRVISLSYYQD